MTQQKKLVSPQYKCPHCKRVVNKPGRYVTLAGSQGITFGASPYDHCPFCRGQIVRQSIIDGEYDYSAELGWVGSFLLLGFWVGVVGIICLIVS